MNKKTDHILIKSLLLSLFLSFAMIIFTGIGSMNVKAENWNESTSLPSRSGTFVLQKDVTLSRSWANDTGVLGGSYYFDLNGHNITMKGMIKAVSGGVTSVNVTITQGSFIYSYRIVVRVPGGNSKEVFKEWFR